MREFKMKMEGERREKRKALEIAKKMKAYGIDEGTIKRLTGIALREIRKL